MATIQEQPIALPPIDLLSPAPVLSGQGALELQHLPPPDAFFLLDAVGAATLNSNNRFPPDIAESACSKVLRAARLSVTRSVASSAIAATAAPECIDELTLERLQSDLSSRPASEADSMFDLDTPDEPYIPDFDDDDAEPDPRVIFQVENATALAINDLRREAANARAHAAIEELRAKNVASGGEEEYERRIELNLKACLTRTFDEISEAHSPLHFTHREAAFVVAAVRSYDPDEFHAMLAAHPDWGLWANRNATGYADGAQKRSENAPHIDNAAVAEVIGYGTLASRAIVRLSGFIARHTKDEGIGGRMTKFGEKLYARALLYGSLLLH